MLTSIIIVTYNYLKDTTIPCFESILKYSTDADYEIIFIDNASTDGTQLYLKELANQYDNVKVIFNAFNKGYAKANNQGLEKAIGDILILLNNDTLVTPGWISLLSEILLKNKNIGLLGPISNSTGNEQLVEIKGINEKNYIEKSNGYIKNINQAFNETAKLGFFCVALRRDVYNKIGLLDESFGIGMFEDDEYCHRVRKFGYINCFTERCFIYHKGSFSFSKLSHNKYHEIFTRNKKIYEEKIKDYWTLTDIAVAFFKKIFADIHSYINENNITKLDSITAREKSIFWLMKDLKEKEKSLLLKNDESSKKIQTLQEKVIEYNDVSTNEIIEYISKIQQSERFTKVIILSATVDFFYMEQRPQQIARELAKCGYLVVYLTKNYYTDNVHTFQRISERLYLLRENHAPLLSHLINPKDMIYFCIWPTNDEIIDFLNPGMIIYDILDDISLLEGDQKIIELKHEKMLKRAHIITISAGKLKKCIPETYLDKVLEINNAVSEQFFWRNINNVIPIAKMSDIKKSTAESIIGYYGAIAKWFDFALIEFLAKKYPQHSFVFIGPIYDVQAEVKRLESDYSNIHFFPQQPIKELIRYLKYFDVAIIPFLLNEITLSVSPVKLFEYCAAGKPVISTALPECCKMPPVHIGASYEEFSEKLELAINLSKSETFKQEMIELATKHTWKSRVAELNKRILMVQD